MFPVKDIMASLYETFNATDEERQAKIFAELREAYYELCRITSWEALRDTLTYVYDADADGMWLPADVIGIDCVTNGTNIWSKAGPTAGLDVNCIEKRWVINDVSRTALVFGKGLRITSGETTFSGVSGITSAHIGESVRIGAENAFYTLKSATELETPYYGPTQTSAAYYVRPAGTKKIKLLAEYSATDETEGVTIFCWRLPEQLFSEDHMCLLPRADILELATAEKIYGTTREVELKNSVQKDLYGSKGRYQGKLDMAIADNPEFIPPRIPLNRHGAARGYGAR